MDFLWNGVSWNAMGQLDVWGHYAQIAANNLGGNFFNSWHQITYVYSGSISSSQIYIDGNLQSGVVGFSNQTDTLSTLNTPLTVGYNFGWINDVGNSVDDIGVWNRALSSTEVTQLYAAQSVPEPSTCALFGIGAIGMLMVMRKKKSA
jgi:hypothetical protein